MPSSYTPAGGGAPSGAAGSDLSGTYPNPTVGRINGIPLPAGAPVAGQYLAAVASGAFGYLLAWVYPIAVKHTASDYTLGTDDPNELYGGVIYVTGACVLTAPAVVVGGSFTVKTEAAVVTSVDPDNADLIRRDGVAQADGEKVTSTGAAGDIAVFTYYDATGWSCSSNGWTNGG